jgi:hypothetical protein
MSYGERLLVATIAEDAANTIDRLTAELAALKAQHQPTPDNHELRITWDGMRETLEKRYRRGEAIDGTTFDCGTNCVAELLDTGLPETYELDSPRGPTIRLHLYREDGRVTVRVFGGGNGRRIDQTDEDKAHDALIPKDGE